MLRGIKPGHSYDEKRDRNQPHAPKARGEPPKGTREKTQYASCQCEGSSCPKQLGKYKEGGALWPEGAKTLQSCPGQKNAETIAAGNCTPSSHFMCFRMGKKSAGCEPKRKMKSM